MFQGPSEAPQSELEVKGTSKEFDLGSFIEKIKAFRTFGQIQSMLMGVSFSLFICHNGHKYQGSRSSESQLRHLGPKWL